MTELAALAAHETATVTRGLACEVHRTPLPCDLCDRYLPMVIAGELVTFDLGSMSVDERRGARVIARMINGRLIAERTETP